MATSPTTFTVAGFSADAPSTSPAITAYPSTRDRENGGTSSTALTGADSVRPTASRTLTVTVRARRSGIADIADSASAIVTRFRGTSISAMGHTLRRWPGGGRLAGRYF